MLRLELSDLQFNRHKARQRTVVKQQIDEKICVANLNTVFFTDKRKVFAKLQNELLQVLDNCFS